MAHKWTRDEEIKMLDSIKKGKNIAEIANIHNRSVNAIELRIQKIAYDNITAGKSLSALSKKINIPEDKINQYYFEYKGFLEKKQGTNIDISKDIKESKEIIKPILSTKKIDNDLVLKSNGTASKLNKLNTKTPKQIANNGDITHKLESESHLMKVVIENVELRKQINKLISEKAIDKKIVDVIKKIEK